MKEISISTEFIKLDQFLKFTGCAQNGAEAKMLVLDGKAYVNGEIERRRGRKLRPGDIISFQNEEFTIV